ncbi:MAG: NAD(P)H-hydrate dehydratase [Candidatus Aenigmatarchaeota archaeon]
MGVVTKNILRKIYKKRDKWVHKGMFGKLGIIAGSYYYSGSPIFVGTAALRAGCDLVRIFAPECISNVIRSFLPDLIVFPYKKDFLDLEVLDFIFENSKNLDAFVIGNGLYRKEQVLIAIKEFVKKVRVPCVIDADAIYAIKGMKLNKSFIITPHSYEFFVLSGYKVSNNLKERVEKVKEVAKKYNAIIVLKGYIDVISDGKRVAINKTGSNYMTKGGFGDILAGICGAFLARKVDSFIAACAATYINGKLGEIVCKRFKESVIASDVFNYFDKVIKFK